MDSFFLLSHSLNKQTNKKRGRAGREGRSREKKEKSERRERRRNENTPLVYLVKMLFFLASLMFGQQLCNYVLIAFRIEASTYERLLQKFSRSGPLLRILCEAAREEGQKAVRPF